MEDDMLNGTGTHSRAPCRSEAMNQTPCVHAHSRRMLHVGLHSSASADSSASVCAGLPTDTRMKPRSSALV